MASQTTDVVIVGGGIAGLAAAFHLTTKENKRVCLLEARGRLGGRIKSMKTEDGLTIDVGALFIQGRGSLDNPSPLSRLLTEFNLKTQALDPLQAECFDTEGNAISWQDLYQSLVPGFEATNMRIQEAKRVIYEVPPTLSEVLFYNEDNIPAPDSKDYWIRKLVTASIMQQTGAKLNQISLLEFMSEERSFGPNEWIVGGAQQLIDILHKEAMRTGNLSVHLDTPASAILHDPHEQVCSVLTPAGEHFDCAAVISAVPLNVIKAGNIKFIPELSKEKQHALKHHHMGHHNIVLLKFDKVFWKKDAHFIYPNDPSIQHFPEYVNLFALMDNKTPLLMAHFYADTARFGKESDETILKKALAPLKKIYPDFEPPLSHHITRWDTSPHTLGSKSFCATGSTSDDLEYISAPEAGGLYFANEYTNPSLHGTVEGAYESGLLAALQIAVYLKHQQRLKEASFRPRHGLT